MESVADDSTLAWSWWQKVVTMTRLPSSTPSVINTVIGMISLLILYIPSEMNSTSACLHIEGITNEGIVTHTQFQITEPPELGALGQTSTLLWKTTLVRRDLPESLCSSARSLVKASGKKENIRFVFKWIGSMGIPRGFNHLPLQSINLYIFGSNMASGFQNMENFIACFDIFVILKRKMAKVKYKLYYCI